MKVVTNDEVKEFNSYKECVNYIARQVTKEAYDLFESEKFDKYALQDILFNLKNRIRYENGYSHPDLITEWEIKE